MNLSPGRLWKKLIGASSPAIPSGRAEAPEWAEIARKVRTFAAYRFIRGRGIEIGALHQPLKVYRQAQVQYLDRLSTAELERSYPELAGETKVQVDLIDDVETLGRVADGSCDFVIANHVLEHCRNPIGAIENMLRVIRPAGILFLAVPDKRFTFDAARPTTPYEHLVRDYREGPAASDEEHFKESFPEFQAIADASEREARIAQALKERTNIHFHVWTQREIIELFLNLRRDFGFPLELEIIAKNGAELLVVARKELDATSADDRMGKA